MLIQHVSVFYVCVKKITAWFFKNQLLIEVLPYYTLFSQHFLESCENLMSQKLHAQKLSDHMFLVEDSLFPFIVSLIGLPGSCTPPLLGPSYCFGAVVIAIFLTVDIVPCRFSPTGVP